MRYILIISKRVEKDISKLHPKYIKRIRQSLTKVLENPFIGKKMNGELQGFYSIRVWPYRILYEIKKKKLIISVLKVTHGKDVYKK